MAKTNRAGWVILATDVAFLGRPIRVVARGSSGTHRVQDEITGRIVTRDRPSPLSFSLGRARVFPAWEEAALFIDRAIIRCPRMSYQVAPVSEAEVTLAGQRRLAEVGGPAQGELF